MEIVNRTTGSYVPDVGRIMGAEELLAAQKFVREVPIGSHLVAYAIDLARASRRDRGAEGDVAPDFVRQYVDWGAGPRAAQFLVLGAKARALIQGRTHVTADDIRQVAYPVLTHRVIVNFAADADGIDSTAVIDRIMQHVPIPDKD